MSRGKTFGLWLLTAALFGSGCTCQGPKQTTSQNSGITMAWEAEPRTLDPRFAVDANSQYMVNLVHCSLVDFDPDGKTIANLASGWEWETPTTLKMAINSAAKFSNGQAVTSADVQATFAFFKAEGGEPTPLKGAFKNLQAVEVIDSNNVRFKIAEADATFLPNLVVGILPADVAQGAMIKSPDQVVGCGPFQVASNNVSGMTLKPNSHYGLGNPAKVESISIKFVKDESTRYAKLRTGELDLVQNLISRDKLPAIAKEEPQLKIMTRPGLNTTYLGFNMRDDVVGNVKVRQALAQAIDRDKIIEYVLNGYAVKATTLITPDDPYYSKSSPNFSFNVEAAKKLLDEAGFKDPDGDGPQPRFELSYKTTTNTTRVAIAKAIGADLAKIGIKVNVQPLEWGRFKDDVEKGKVQMWSLSWIGFKDPDIYRYAFATESFPPNGGNRGWYSNEALDQLLLTAKTEPDLTKRKAAYKQVQDIVGQELPYVFLWHEEIFAVVNERVQDFEIYADGRFAALARAYKR